MQAQPNDALAIPAISLFELQLGTELLRQQDRDRAQEFDRWIDQAVAATTILALDANAASEAARLLRKQPMELVADAMIAAIANVHGLVVATRNTRDFQRFGVEQVNPFLYRS
jgi:predicted nucleic acid-binding protein